MTGESVNGATKSLGIAYMKLPSTSEAYMRLMLGYNGVQLKLVC